MTQEIKITISVDESPDTVCVKQIKAVDVYLKLHEALNSRTYDEMCDRLSRWSDEVAKTIREGKRLKN